MSDKAASDKQYVREEIACALRISPLTVNARLHVARELVDRLPATLALLDASSTLLLRIHPPPQLLQRHQGIDATHGVQRRQGHRAQRHPLPRTQLDVHT